MNGYGPYALLTAWPARCPFCGHKWQHPPSQAEYWNGGIYACTECGAKFRHVGKARMAAYWRELDWVQVALAEAEDNEGTTETKPQAPEVAEPLDDSWYGMLLGGLRKRLDEIEARIAELHGPRAAWLEIEKQMQSGMLQLSSRVTDLEVWLRNQADTTSAIRRRLKALEEGVEGHHDILLDLSSRIRNLDGKP